MIHEISNGSVYYQVNFYSTHGNIFFKLKYNLDFDRNVYRFGNLYNAQFVFIK